MSGECNEVRRARPAIAAAQRANSDRTILMLTKDDQSEALLMASRVASDSAGATGR